MASRASAVAVAAVLAGMGVLLAAGQGTQALFNSATSNGGNSFSSAPDLTAPSASPSLIAKTTGYATGYVKQGGSFYVYANVSDAGSPPSGTSTVTANVSGFDAGQTSVPLTSGSYSAGGTSFNYRSAALSANNPQAQGSYSYSLTLRDTATNERSQSFSVQLDNTPPTGTDVQAVDGNGSAGTPGTGDQVVFTFSEPMEPDTVLAGWTGAATTVTLRIKDGGVVLGLLGDDVLDVRNAANTANLPLGSVNLKAGGYASGLLGGFAVFSNSTMTMSGSQITVTLGTRSGLSVGDGGCCPSMQWSTQSTPTDRAGNNTTTGTVTESGAGDRDF